MSTKNFFLRHAIDLAGGPTKAANLVGVANATVYQWLNQGGISKAAQALKLGQATRISYEKLLRNGRAHALTRELVHPEV